MIHHGDCLDVMAAMEPESVDAIVTDPPYDLTGVRWDSLGAGPSPQQTTHVRGRGGFMGKAWDGTGVAFRRETWEAAYRVAKPSAYLLAFGGTRTVHRMTVALEDAGWIIRDMLVWAYASGFPKSKASLKPAWEPIVMARKPGPLRMLAIDSCRIGVGDDRSGGGSRPTRSATGSFNMSDVGGRPSGGRWPANVILTDPIFDGGVEGVVGGGEASYNPAGVFGQQRVDQTGDTPAPFAVRRDGDGIFGYGDSGTYSRFFLIPRDSRSDTLSGIIGTCHICAAPIAETPSTARTRQLDTAPPSAATPPSASPAQPASGAASPSPSPGTATAPRRVLTPLDGTLGSTASEADPTTASDTSGTTTSTLPEPTPDTASLSDQPARTAEPPTISTDTTTTTAAPWMCERCADDATHGRTLPPPRLIGREPHDDEWPSPTRFLIIPKADRGDREPVVGGLPLARAGAMSGPETRPDRPTNHPMRANSHPTVKPTELMRHLVRLVTPSGGTVLDPFLGSGTTGLACELEGFPWIGIEKEAEYVAIAEARLNGTQRGLGLAG